MDDLQTTPLIWQLLLKFESGQTSDHTTFFVFFLDVVDQLVHAYKPPMSKTFGTIPQPRGTVKILPNDPSTACGCPVQSSEGLGARSPHELNTV